MFIIFLIGQIFNGKSMATLPFEPFSSMRGMTHRNVPGDDFTQMSPFFLSMMTAQAIRSLIARYNGFDGPRMPLKH